eukprot:sb/3465508/
MDGMEDCLDGSDEIPEMWERCGKGPTLRFKEAGRLCSEVFRWRDGGYTELTELCDGVDPTGLELSLCEAARSYFDSGDRSTVNEERNGIVGLSWCVEGVYGLKECAHGSFNYSPPIFGVDTDIAIYAPKDKVDCSHFYGEQYLYMACSGSCTSSQCPLQHNILSADSCPGQYRDRVYTVMGNEHLTFATPSHRDGGWSARETHYRTLEKYYGRSKRQVLSWDMILDLVNNMFSHDYIPEIQSRQNNHNMEVRRMRRVRKKRLHRKIFLIILSDFICWVPFTVLCALHSLQLVDGTPWYVGGGEHQYNTSRKRGMGGGSIWVPFTVLCALHSLQLVDGTPWYGLFSVLILPLNSVINPIIYDVRVEKALFSRNYEVVKRWFQKNPRSDDQD